MKYVYELEAYGWGGETSIHTVSEEFFALLNTMEEDDANSLLDDLIEGAESLDIPQIKDDLSNDCFYWHDGDLHHETSPMDDYLELKIIEVSKGTPISQVTLESSELEILVGLENYNDHPPESINNLPNLTPLPTIGFCATEKGFMGRWVIETDEPFNRSLLKKVITETSFGDFIQSFYYGDECLDCVDYPEGYGKGTYVNMGHIVKQWFETGDWFEKGEYLLEDVA